MLRGPKIFSGSLISKGKQPALGTSNSDARYGKFERFVGVPVLFVQGPCDHLIQLFQVLFRLFGHMPHDRVNGFRFVVAFFALDQLFGRHSTF